MRDDGPQILVFPAWRDNPFLNLLSLAPRAAGYRFLATTSFSGLMEQIGRLGPGDVLHLHWTSPLLQSVDVADVDDARSRLRAFVSRISGMRAAGVGLVWTIHNRLPHELRFRDEEISLIRFLAEVADRVHIMAPATLQLMSEIVTISAAKVAVIPHPSYAGIYDSGQPKATARASFDLREEDRAVLFLGQIRPYKGVEALVRAVDLVAERGGDRPPVLLLAGHATDATQAELASVMPTRARSVTRFSFVPDADIARWFSAADVAVFPYRAILNSGSVHLAATFHVPVVIPDEPHLRDQYEAQPWTAYFDTTDPVNSIADVLSDGGRFAQVNAADFESFLAPISPWTTSRAYLSLVRDVSASRVAA